MLSPAELAGRDLSGLRAERRRAQHLAVLQDRHRRHAESIGITKDHPETHNLVQAAGEEAAASAAHERLIALAIRLAADESSGRPASARHTHPDPLIPSRDGLVARALAVLRGAPIKDFTP